MELVEAREMIQNNFVFGKTFRVDTSFHVSDSSVGDSYQKLVRTGMILSYPEFRTYVKDKRISPNARFVLCHIDASNVIRNVENAIVTNTEIRIGRKILSFEDADSIFDTEYDNGVFCIWCNQSGLLLTKEELSRPETIPLDVIKLNQDVIITNLIDKSFAKAKLRHIRNCKNLSVTKTHPKV